jgi:hypothetical protein
MQLKYMSVAGQAISIALETTKAVVQSLNPEVLKRAGFEVDPKFWGDDLGEKLGWDAVNMILNEGFGLSGRETLKGYFDKMAEIMVGKAGALNHLPGDAQKRTMLMWLRSIQRVVEGGVQHHYKKKVGGLGSSGTEGELVSLNFEDPTFGWIDKWLVHVYRERGDEVVFPHGESPYVSAQGHKVVYKREGVIDPGSGKWQEKDVVHFPLRERYGVRKLEMFSTNVFGRIMEEYLRDNTTFDVADKEWLLEQIRHSKNKKRSDYEAVRKSISDNGENPDDYEKFL